MASERGQTEICSFLLQVEEQVAASSGHSYVAFCKNPVVNALIEYYYGMAQIQGTEFQVRLDAAYRCGTVYGAGQSFGQCR